MYITINKALVLGKVVRERINDLKTLRSGVATKRTLFGDTREVTEPTYDIRALDERVLKLQHMAFAIETAVKEANNTTFVTIEGDVEKELFEAIK